MICGKTHTVYSAGIGGGCCRAAGCSIPMPGRTMVEQGKLYGCNSNVHHLLVYLHGYTTKLQKAGQENCTNLRGSKKHFTINTRIPNQITCATVYIAIVWDISVSHLCLLTWINKCKRILVHFLVPFE